MFFTMFGLRTASPALALMAVLPALAAEQYPARPLRMIIPAGPSGGVDTIARVIAQPLGAALGQPVVMDNKPGAGTMLASELTARAPADGYTLLMATNSHVINAGIHNDLRYDPVNDFAAVTLVASAPFVLVVHPVLRARSVAALIALARANPGQLEFASAGAGSGTHLAGELFAAMAQIKMVHVPYRSGSSALVDVAGGHVQIMFSNTINSGPFVRSGKLRALAVTSAQRTALYPQLPTVAESGLRGYQADAWYGALLPARTPADIVARLHKDIVAILKLPEVRRTLAAQGADAIGNSPAEFAAIMKADIAKWAGVAAKLPLQTE